MGDAVQTRRRPATEWPDPGCRYRQAEHRVNARQAELRRATIFALSTAPGKSGVAVVRISGAAAGPALLALTGRLPAARHAALSQITDPVTGEVVDSGLVLYFPAPRSFTGEDVAELHVHGGRATVAGVLDALGRLPDLRPAEPGEFARRAFAAGKLDLAQAEALADLIDAETAGQRRQALRGLDGGLGRCAEEWREQLIAAMAYAETAIDFSDEDVPPELLDQARAMAAATAGAISRLIEEDGGRGERVAAGARIVITGPPNAGKSSLFNWFVRRPAAIVSPRPGTTRDVIELRLDIGGHAVTLVDTAGLREAADPIEREGVLRAQAAADAADLVLWLDSGDMPAHAAPSCEFWQLWPKADLRPAPHGHHAISVVDGTGLDHLMARLKEWIETRFDTGPDVLITRARHRLAFEEARRALEGAAGQREAELVAEDIRAAATALGRISGRIGVEDVLDRIFASFCIGK